MFTAFVIATFLTTQDRPSISAPPVVTSEKARLKPGTLKPGERAYELKFTVYQGDPAGTRQDRTLRVLTNPTLIARDDQPVRFGVVNGEVTAVTPDGPTLLKNGLTVVARIKHKDKDSVEVAVSCEDQSAVADNQGTVHVSSRFAKLLGKIALGEPQSMTLAENDPKNACWVELTIRPVEVEE